VSKHRCGSRAIEAHPITSPRHTFHVHRRKVRADASLITDHSSDVHCPQPDPSEHQGEDRGFVRTGAPPDYSPLNVCGLACDKDTVHIFRTLRNTARVYKNKVSQEVVRLERRPQGAKFEELRDLVSGARGRVSFLLSASAKSLTKVFAFGRIGRVRDW